MLFLKQIRANGFKSFADQTTLDFTSEMIGVVGPNGSGKSNITDAIRWTLGEQSSKSLRGSNMMDIIFSGSADRKGAEFAEVTLVFNNKKDVFSTMNTELVEITRKYIRKTKDSEFYINGEKVRMKDVQDLALETGLTKSSIAIISQGTISRFAEAKANDRREIFDDAAGVAKYKKRKKETVSSLMRSEESLFRLKDIIDEIGRRLPTLEKQANKAMTFKEKIDEVKKFEVEILSKDAVIYRKRLSELKHVKEELDIQIKSLTNEINLSSDSISLMMTDSKTTEQKANRLQEEFQTIIQKLSSLREQKRQLEEKELQNNSNTDIEEIRAIAIKKDFNEKRIQLNSEKDSNNQNKEKLRQLESEYSKISNNFETQLAEIQTITRNIDRLNFSKNEMERSNARLSASNANAAQLVVANNSVIGGVIGTLQSLVNVPEEYQIAISAASAGPMQSVVMKGNAETKKAIDFLKKNNAGRATFLALDTISPNVIQGVQRDAIARANGFIGIANELVNIDAKYQKALDYALGTIVVVDNYDNARNLALNTNHKFNIVTISGERFLPKGAVVGGNSRNSNIFQKQQSGVNRLEEIIQKIEILESQEQERTLNLNSIKNQKDVAKDSISTLQASISASFAKINQLEMKIEELSNEYKVFKGVGLLEGTQSRDSDPLSAVIKEITLKEKRRDEIQIELNEITVSKNKASENQVKLHTEYKEKNIILSNKKDEASSINAEYAVLLEHFGGALKVLEQKYSLTPEKAFEIGENVQIENEDEIRAKVQELIIEIEKAGSINMDSIEEHRIEKERYDLQFSEYTEVKDSVDKLRKIISDIDIAMETQFKRVVDDVNGALPEAFAKLFGGGTAKLIYTDPENILETGIDIEVAPPGKKINNLNLLSGGEKSLVALSVLFSILKVRPLPLVILDEAEAPLDPANVERFARYVKQFTKDTQFIIVTHREGTMENCDTLFGVTMETKGITKIVSLKLIDAKAQSSDQTQSK